jgi:xanthine dehydrogenase large subunit
VGEPPLVYGLGALFAIRAAIESVRPDLTTDVIAPMTPERIFTLLHSRLAGDRGGDA